MSVEESVEAFAVAVIEREHPARAASLVVPDMAAETHEKVEKPIAALVVALVAGKERQGERGVDLAVRPKVPPIWKRGESPIVAPIERHGPVGIAGPAEEGGYKTFLAPVVKRQHPMRSALPAEERSEGEVVVVVIEREEP